MLKLLFVAPPALLFALLAQNSGAPADKPMPADAATLTNPVKPTAESTVKAKKMYGLDCAMCHGADGNGKGDLVADMQLTLKDWTDPAALKNVPDGELFYIIKNGKGKMPPEGDRGKDGDIWNMVILVRSFAKK